MIAAMIVRAALVAGLLFVSFAGPVRAQQPSANAIALAKEVISLKGGFSMFDPLIPGVVESVRRALLQQNFMLQKDINEVAAQLRKDFEARRPELLNIVARVYAQRFSEQELKEIAAFYKTPLGKKLITQEPLVAEESLQSAQTWADNLSREVAEKMRAEMKKKGHDL